MPGVMKTVDLSKFDQRWVSGVPVPESDWYAGRADRHTTVPVSVGLTWAWIDSEIASLIHYLWKGGVVTTDYCQDLFEVGDESDQEKMVWIGFATLADMDRFSDLVFPPNDPEGEEVQEARTVWEWDASPQYGQDGRMGGSVLFPSSSLGWILINVMVKLGLGEDEIMSVVDELP